MGSKNNPSLDQRFITTIKNRDFVLYSGLLDLAHQRGLKSIHVEAIQYPTEDNNNEAICKAVVESQDGQFYEELGDASPRSVNPMIKYHILRMAATRAKARALRDMVNIGMTCLEELSDPEDVIGQDEPVKAKPVKRKSTKEADEKGKNAEKAKEENKRTNSKKAEKRESGKDTKAVMSDAQKKAIYNLAQRRGIDTNSLESMAEDAFKSSLELLSAQDASSFIRTLQQAA